MPVVTVRSARAYGPTRPAANPMEMLWDSRGRISATGRVLSHRTIPRKPTSRLALR